MNQSLFELIKSNAITFNLALEYSSDPDDLRRTCQKA
jgi:Tfp pilus assembly ATPase PilU